MRPGVIVGYIVILAFVDSAATFTVHASASANKDHMHRNSNLFQNIATKLRGGASMEEVPDPTMPEPQVRRLHGMMFSGKILPNVRSLVAGGSEANARGFNAVKEFYHTGDIITLILLVALPVPFMRICHSLYYKIIMMVNKKKEYKNYDQSRLSGAAKFVSQGGLIAAFVYFVELLTTFSVNVMAYTTARQPMKPINSATVPKNLAPMAKIPGLVANIAYGYWLTNSLIKFKARLLRRFYARLPDAETYDGMLNYLIYIIASILILDASEFDLRALVRSLVAVGGLSSIVVGLALKDPVSELLQGALLMISNKFHRNENIRLGDGTQGKVINIGLFETTLMGGDDITFKLPHSKLTKQKFSNISRVERSQTKFQLRFHLYEMPRIQEIASSIEQELRVSCPKLITDGSRPFRVIWTDISEDHIVVTVDTHHSVPPATGAYWEARGQVLQAIATASAKVKAKLAVPVQATTQLR